MDVSMSLNGSRICWGVKAKNSRRLKCGEPVNDPRVIEEVMKLINEFLNRVKKHKSVLLSNEMFCGITAYALFNWFGMGIRHL
ncbi:hypothetical protein [Vulcanisaeta distributa]|uniref:hypothetical protein n=1 Tax=Vulcanisaeta distributa TaxID=164451 RepID=UPI0006D1BD16|nr:hypothetical protein [Vulcanisaeta distributa]